MSDQIPEDIIVHSVLEIREGDDGRIGATVMFQGKNDPTIRWKGDIVLEINAKYYAELAALETTQGSREAELNELKRNASEYTDKGYQAKVKEINDRYDLSSKTNDTEISEADKKAVPSVPNRTTRKRRRSVGSGSTVKAKPNKTQIQKDDSVKKEDDKKQPKCKK